MAKNSLLEPELAGPYGAWKAAPTPDTSAALLAAVRPHVERAIRLHVGESNPLIESRARRMALEGMRRYDPAAGSIKTHLTRHLEGLKRAARRQTTILRVPERVALDRSSVESAAREFEAEVGRAPSDGELADHTGFSLARIRRVRSYRPAVAEGTLDALLVGDAPAATGLAGGKAESLWQQLIYADLTPTDQRVVDLHRAGHSNVEIARQLGIPPGAVSQRKARIQGRYDEGEDLGLLS